MIWNDLATWRPIQYNFTDGGVNRPPLGMVLHIAEGPFGAIWNWSNNPAAEVSCYFASAKDGRLEQHVDLDNKAWTQGNGNASWIGVEHEGYAGETLSPQQVENAAQLFAKIVRTWPSVPLSKSDSPNTPGLGWHGMGGSSWGGHPGCPGEPIKAQRDAILSRARQINEGEDEDMGLTPEQQAQLDRIESLQTAVYQQLLTPYESGANLEGLTPRWGIDRIAGEVRSQESTVSAESVALGKTKSTESQ